jgi:hypothetical protein
MTATQSRRISTSLDEFRAALLDYRSISSWATGGSVAVPMVDYVLGLGPPWPWAAGVPVITSVAELLVLILVFHLWLRSGREKVSRRLIRLLVLLVIVFGFYLFLNSSFTFSSPVDGQKYIKGFQVRPDVAPVLTADYTAADALKEAEYRPEEVWTSLSISTMRLGLLFLWLLSFASLSATISSFVLYHRGKPARKTRGQTASAR